MPAAPPATTPLAAAASGAGAAPSGTNVAPTRAEALNPQPAAGMQPSPSPAEQGKLESPAAAAPLPLKPRQLRLALRDERLLPTQASSGHTVTARRPRKRYFTADEARRLFSATLRTRDHDLRQLATDEAQLARYGLPIWLTEAEVAASLELEVNALRHFSTHSAHDTCAHYVTFAIPKRSGGERLIMAPKTRLKRLQRQLNALLVSKLPVSEYAHGFLGGHSVRTNAEPHVGKDVILRLDITDFFGTIHFGRVRGLLIALGYGYPVATVLAALMTDAARQPVVVGETRFFPPVGPRVCPQGAPTSPGLSNALVVKMDRRLAGLARGYGFAYTRYADDLTFSGNDIAGAHALRLLATRVVEEEGFKVNERKTQVRRSGSRQTVTGVVVNDILGLSRKERRRLRAAIHQYAKARVAGNGDPALLARLDGKVAYVSMLNAAQARQLAPR
jgi:RNA-directed DNA polymerase